MNIIEEIKDIKEKLNNLTRSNQPSYSEYYKINEPIKASGSLPTFDFILKNTYSSFNLQSILAKGDAVRWKESPTGNYKYGNIANVTNFSFSVIPNLDYAANSSSIYSFEKAIVAKPTDFPNFFRYSATITPMVSGATFNVQNSNNISTRYTVVRGNILSVFVDISSVKINTPANTSLRITIPVNHAPFEGVQHGQLGFCLNNEFHLFCLIKRQSNSEALVTPYFPWFNGLNIYNVIIGFVDTGSNFTTAFNFVYTYSF